ncbi:hypothetical protein ACFQ80_05730 [Isoptericola sp. NPDC056578]|uniref:hypothetical protein n=1 Tax=Isoptericola sp. NPDC056578 TaxID=3345870 RepID=UPI0036AEBD65
MGGRHPSVEVRTLARMRRAGDDLFPWKTCGQPLFDRIVNALLTEICSGGPGVLEPVDGRGGDGGIDLDLTLPDGTIDTIYQLKYFPEGFSGGFRPRRQQITKSFKAAMKHNPRRWVLVVPCNLTPKERDFVRSLAGKPAVVEIGTTIGQARLDLALAEHPRVWKHFTHDQRMDDLRIAGLERQGLTTAADIDEYATSMGESLAARSLHWDLQVTTGPDGVATRVSARHPRAMEEEPLASRISFVPGPVGEEARRRYEDARAFGTPVDLGADEIAKVELTGAEWFDKEFTDVNVHLRPPPLVRGQVDLRVTTPSGNILQIVRGTMDGHAGQRGRRILAALECGLDLTITILDTSNPDHRKPTENVPVDLTVSASRLHRGDAIQAARAVQLIDHLESGSKVILELWRAGKMFAQMGTNGDTDEHRRHLISAYDRQLIDDLRVLSKHFDITLRVPEQMTLAQRAEIRKARLLAEGNVIIDSDLGGLDVTLSGVGGEPFTTFLKDEASMIAVESKLHYLVDGQPLAYAVRIFHPRAHAVDADTVAAALAAGTAANMPVTIRGVDRSPYRVYSVSDFPDDREDLTPTPLAIVLPDGMDIPPDEFGAIARGS